MSTKKKETFMGQAKRHRAASEHAKEWTISKEQIL